MQQAVKKHQYPNGLTLVVDEATEMKSVSVGAWVKTGSRHEDLDSWGMCHFLEHMIFKGGKKRGAIDISKAVDRVGGDFNAFTSREHTCFHFYLPAKEVKLGADLLKEILFRPLFAANEIEKEREVILQEIAMTKETPEEESFDRFLEKTFDKHSLGRNILGNAESIKAITRKKVFQFFHQHYRPENMLIVISGAISFEKARRTFALIGEKAWPGRGVQKTPPPRWGMDPPEGTTSGFWWLDDKSEQAHLVYGIPAPVRNQKERMISVMLQQYLGGGMSSVLFDQIREKHGWAYTVYATALPFLDTSLFTIYAGVKTERVYDSLKVFTRELKKIAQTGLPITDLKRIQDSLIYSYDLSLESTESRMMTVSSSELFFKREFSLKEYGRIVKSIRVSDIQELMQIWLKSGMPSILVLGEKPRKREVWAKLQEKSQRLTSKPIYVEKQK